MRLEYIRCFYVKTSNLKNAVFIRCTFFSTTHVVFLSETCKFDKVL